MMTFEEALEIACEELQVNVEYLRDTNKGYESRIESECNMLLTARNVLLKELWIQKQRESTANLVKENGCDERLERLERRQV